MAVQDWYTDAPGLRAVFPSIVQAASEGQTTAQVWQTIRSSADEASAAQLSIQLGRAPTAEEVAESSSFLLRGVGIQQVNGARAAAGQMVAAHAALSGADPDAQITADMVGVPPWSITSNAAGVQTQYRIHVQREIVVHGFTAITRQEWASYNLSGPITSIADALDQANSLFGAADYNRNVDINQILDYSIETV
jgi:hypothetical protein